MSCKRALLHHVQPDHPHPSSPLSGLRLATLPAWYAPFHPFPLPLARGGHMTAHANIVGPEQAPPSPSQPLLFLWTNPVLSHNVNLDRDRNGRHYTLYIDGANDGGGANALQISPHNRWDESHPDWIRNLNGLTACILMGKLTSLQAHRGRLHEANMRAQPRAAEM